MNLARIEIEHNNLKSYIKKSLIICVATLFVMLFIFADDEIYKNVSKLLENWPSMIYIVSLTLLFCFAILASVMYSKFVVSEYSGKRAILLFSYPIKRKKLVQTKCGIITVFSVLSIAICHLIILGLFISISHFSNPGEMIISKDHIIYMFQMLSLTVIFSIVIGIISGYLGLVSQSIQTTLVSAIIFCVISTQIIGYIYTGDYDAVDYTNLVIIVNIALITLGILFYKLVVQKIQTLEID